MNKYIVTTLLSCALGTVSSFADWNVVSTFDDAAALDIVTDVTNIEGSNARTEIVDGKLAAFPGDLFELNSNLYAMVDLGVDIKAASVASGGPVTLYMEVSQPTVSDGAGGTRKAIVDAVWGMANIGPDAVLDSRYNSYNVMQRINVGTDSFEGRNDTSYEAVDLFQADTTYKIWMVIDYTLNFYEAYIQGGQWTEQTRLSTAESEGIWLFRVNPAPENMVQYMLIALSRGNTVQGEKGLDPIYFDNIAIDTAAQNLTMPPVGDGPEMWGDYPVTADGDANTGDWMGWVNVNAKPYIFNYALQQWMYIDPAPTSSAGQWVYVFKF